MITANRPLTQVEWTGTLLGLGVVIGAGLLIESTPAHEYGQILLILGAAVLVSAACMGAVRTFSKNRRVRRVPLKPEVDSSGYANI